MFKKVTKKKIHLLRLAVMAASYPFAFWMQWVTCCEKPGKKR